MNKNEDIKLIQTTLMDDLNRLNNEEYMKKNGKQQIARSNAIAKTASTYLQSASLVLKINDAKEKNKKIINEK